MSRRCRWIIISLCLLAAVGCERAPAPGPSTSVPKPKPKPQPKPQPSPVEAVAPTSVFSVSRGEHEGLDTLTVENAKVRVTFLPAVGGRVYEYTLRSSGHNQFWNNPDVPAPEDVPRYHPYGGLDDHLDLDGGDTSPKKLPLAPFTCEVVESDDNVIVSLTYETDTWRLCRMHAIYPDSTRLHTREVVTNLAETPRELVPRPHPVFAVGGEADNADYVITPVGGATLTHRYAAPFNRDVPVPAGTWAGVVDAAKHEAVVLTFDADAADEINLWFAKSSYNVEPVRAPRMLKQGESTTMTFDMFILSDNDLATEALKLPVAEDALGGIAEALDTFARYPETIARIDRGDFYLAPWGYFALELPNLLVAADDALTFGVRFGTFLMPGSGGDDVDSRHALLKKDTGKPVTGFAEDVTSSAVPVGRATPLTEHEIRSLVIPSGMVKEAVEIVTDAPDARAFPLGVFHRDDKVTLDVKKLADDTYSLVLELGVADAPTAFRPLNRIVQDVVIARGLRRKIETSKAGEKDKFKPKYAGAKFYLGAAERAGRGANANIPAAASTQRTVERYLKSAREYLAGNYAKGQTGSFSRFYYAPIDDSGQGYRLYVPKRYDKRKKTPLVVFLHGRDPNYRPFHPDLTWETFEPLAERDGVILLRPHGRGNLGYRGPGADDVLRAIAHVRDDYNIDPERITLTGQSMGGGGTWNLATRYPGRFAAIAPVYGPTDRGISRRNQKNDTPWTTFANEAASPVRAAEALCGMPVWVYHGVKDPTVSVEHSRRMVKRLKELKVDVTYDEDPEGVHRFPSDRYEKTWKFLLAHKREANAKRVCLRTPHLRFAENRWARIDAFDRPMQFMELSAAIDGDLITVDTRNVTAFTLTLNKDLVALKKKLAVSIDGVATFLLDNAGKGTLSFVLAPSKKTERPRWKQGKASVSRVGAVVKNATVEGPIDDVFRRRFILVVGTAGNGKWDDACRALAEYYNEDLWRRVQHVDCIIRKDVEVTKADRKEANLVLIGGPAVNTVTKELVAKLPVKFSKNAFTLAGTTFKQPNAAVAMCVPNPTHVDRMVVLLAGNTPEVTRRMFHWRNYGRFRALDYYAFVDAEQDTSPAWVGGIFDGKWKFDKRTQWETKPK